MKIKISNLKKMTANEEPFLFTAPSPEIFPEALQEAGSLWQEGEITVTGTVCAKGATMEASGKIKAVLHTACNLCLEKMTVKMEIPFRQEYQETETNEKFFPEFAESDLNYYQGEEIDLEPFVRETLLLEKPLRCVCRPNCRGLCPECGANLNITDCGCQKIDARLSVLEDFFKNEKEDS
jgi:uncharacterized protein